MPFIVKFMRDIFSGPDGETYAIGRVYSVPVLVIGLSVPVVSIYKATLGVPPGMMPTMTDLAVGLTGIAGAVSAMIMVTNHVDTPGATLMKPQGG